MCSKPLIRAEGLKKAFAIFSAPEDRLKQILLSRGKRKFYKTHWAVRGVDLEIFPGETVGIVGRNGSGKSTLLQLICGIIDPTAGEVEVRGRIAPLLQLGAGFNPELAGRENVFLNASILGLPDAEIHRRYDMIVDFAELADVMDQPVKTYSSGMFARLAFAVAIHVDPEILIVDEALSVGDEAFQRKCFAKIQQIRDAGATVLFVSHSTGTITSLCDRVLLMDRGEIIAEGPPKHIVNLFYRLVYAPPPLAESVREAIVAGGFPLIEEGNAIASVPEDATQTLTTRPASSGMQPFFDPSLQPKSTQEYESRGCRIVTPRVLTLGGQQVNVLVSGFDYIYTYDVLFEREAANVRCGMMIKSTTGIEIGGFASQTIGEGIACVSAGSTLTARFRFQGRLNAGTFFFNAGVQGVVDGEFVFLHRILDALMVRVPHDPRQLATGYVNLLTDIPCELILPTIAPCHG